MPPPAEARVLKRKRQIERHEPGRAPLRRRLRAAPAPPAGAPPKPQVRYTDYALHRGVGAAEALGDTAQEAVVVVCVAPRHLTTDSVAFQQRQLWGCDVYTDDSDVPCMLQHTGNFVLTPQEGQNARFDYLSVRLRVQRYGAGMPGFAGRDRNGVRSRSWGTGYHGARISIVSVATVKDGKETVLASSVAAGLRPYIPHLVPWGAPDSATLSSDVSLSFDLLNEPCLCYNITAVADKGFDQNLWPSRRLATEVMYLESLDERYELAAVVAAGEEAELVLRWSRVKPATMARLRVAGSVRGSVFSKSATGRGDAAALGTPLPAPAVDVISPAVTWPDLQWTPDGVTVEGEHFVLRKLVFAPISCALRR